MLNKISRPATILIAILLLIFATYKYLHRTFSLVTYSPREVTCVVKQPSQVVGKIRFETQTQNFLFRVTQEGVYRKTLLDTEWNELICPTPIEFGFFFRTTNHSDTVVSSSEYGIFVSEDAGVNWAISYEDIAINATYISQNNILYIIAAEMPVKCNESTLAIQNINWKSTTPDGTTTCIRDRILSSSDNGKTWVDITGNIPVAYLLNGIWEDSRDSSKVCLNANLIRGYDFYLSSSFFGNYNWKRYPYGTCKKYREAQ